MQELTLNASQALTYNRLQWQKGYESQIQEHDYLIDEIEGQIPPDLQGTLFRNGPGLLDVKGAPLHHPFDGDGMISSVAFKDGKANFRNRFVRTEGFVKEQATGKIEYRGVFGTQKPGGWLNNAFDLNLKNIANTNVIYWGGKLLALWEAAEPHRLDPHTLETVGIDYLDGILKPKDAFAAHPRFDPSCKLDNNQPCLVNFSIKPGLSTKITIYEIDPQGKLLRNHIHTVPGFAFIHDFVITPNYCIFFQNSVTFNPIPFLLGLRGAGECVEFHPNQPTKILLIPRTPPYKEIKTFEVKAGFIFHHANAFEVDNRVVIDSICYKTLPTVKPNSSFKDVDFESLDPGQLWRFNLNLTDNTTQAELTEPRCCEFPAVNPHKVGQNYRYMFIGAADQPTGNAPLQALLKLDLDTGDRQLWSFAPQGYASEPIFVPKPNSVKEDEGWVIMMIYDGGDHRSKVAIFDAQEIQAGPLAVLRLKYHIPYGLHGNWTEEYFGS